MKISWQRPDREATPLFMKSYTSPPTSPPPLTGTHIAYFHLCHRKLWLFAHGINMEQRSSLVAEGKWLETQHYQQRAARWKELSIEGIRIDHYDARKGLVREVKKTNQREEAHLAQVKYYLFVLERNGIPVRQGQIEYPRLRETTPVWLTEIDRELIPQWEKEIRAIIDQLACPSLVPKSLCQRCAYRAFCYC